MSKKGFLYFALGAAAGAAGLYYLKKSGGLHFSVDIEASDDADVDLNMEDDIGEDAAKNLNDDIDTDVEIIVEKKDCDCAESGAEPEV